jgi:glycerol-3-phosphate acyltransferase PlsX
MKIAVDAMGGDFAPRNAVQGAVEACREFQLPIILVGREQDIHGELDRLNVRGLPIEVVHAEEVVGMDEPAITAIRKKKKSSIRIGARLVKDGDAQGFVSAGNTGAVMATSTIVMKSLEGVKRPALATVVPTMTGASILLDVGANVDCRARHLMQFAVMGSFYAEAILGRKRPKIGLLSIGEEASKGNEQTRQVFDILRQTSINFVGNVEGRDVFNGSVDVIVCDGFVGNITLKVSESLAETMEHLIRAEIKKSILARIGYLFMRPAFNKFKKRVDYSEYGGAPLLGISGVTIICHGRSSAKAIKNAVRVAGDFCAKDVNGQISRGLAELVRQEESVAV